MTLNVEHRFGQVNALAEPIEWLTDNGSYYTAPDTRRFARNIGFVPCTTPFESPQSNGMAEAFVRTLKRDYARVDPKPDARTVIEQLPRWFAHYNTVHPHRAPRLSLPPRGHRSLNPRGTVRRLGGNNTSSRWPHSRKTLIQTGGRKPGDVNVDVNNLPDDRIVRSVVIGYIEQTLKDRSADVGQQCQRVA